MLKDEFKTRYTTIPFATFTRNHKKNTLNSNFTSLSHRHKELELLLILDGKARFYIDMKAYEAQKGDIIIIAPYLLHNATIFADENLHHYCLCFDLDIIPDKALCHELEKGYAKPVQIIKAKHEASNELAKCIENAYKANELKTDGFELEVIGSMCVFFGLLKQHRLIEKQPLHSENTDICYKITDYIENHYPEEITSSDIAETLFISSSYFCRIFKKNFGYSFGIYLGLYRIEKAKLMLKTTDTPVSEIAMAVGFGSFSYFSKIFRKTEGTTPHEYRKTHSLILHP